MDDPDTMYKDMERLEVILAVCDDSQKMPVIIKATAEERFDHLAQFDGILAKDNCFTHLPENPGVYRCQVSYYYLPPDEWVYVVKTCVQLV